MELKTWKTLAIIFLIIIILENIFIVWGWYMLAQDEEKTYDCYYDVCSGYADVWYDNNVCYCYEYDILGNLVINKTKYMN